MKKLLLLACIFFSIGLQAQIPRERALIYPQTWIVSSGTTGFRIITSNDSIASKIVYLDGITRFTYSKKEDRYGQYWERSFYFNNRSWNMVVKWVDSLNNIKSP